VGEKAQCGIIELNHMPFLRLLTVGLWLMMSCSTKDMLHRPVASGWAGQVLAWPLFAGLVPSIVYQSHCKQTGVLFPWQSSRI